MQLEEFVSESLRQIIAGVKRAQDDTKEMGAKINPDGLRFHVENHRVEFDVAVTAAEGTGTKGGIGVVAGVFNLGSAGESNASSTTASRIKFGVIVELPPGPHHNEPPTKVYT